MLGHEHVKDALLTYLAARVPERLGVLRTRLSVASPVDPVAYTAADSLTLGNQYPVVLVRSTSMPKLQQATTPTPGLPVVFAVSYQLEVVVACDAGAHGDYAAACTDRDRLLLAVREALLTAGVVGEGISLQTNRLAEQTGAAAETLQGRPLAAGSITLTAIVVETLTAPADAVTEDADAFDTTLTAYSADQSLP